LGCASLYRPWIVRSIFFFADQLGLVQSNVNGLM
jgi:hypothetical protein